MYSFYRRAIATAFKRLRVFVERREQLDRFIANLSRVVTANAEMLPDSERDEALRTLQELVGGPPGFTDAVREFMRRNAGLSFTAIEVRERLKTVNFDVGAYDNPLASIHTILKRLVLQGEVERYPDGAYRWKAH